MDPLTFSSNLRNAPPRKSLFAIIMLLNAAIAAACPYLDRIRSQEASAKRDLSVDGLHDTTLLGVDIEHSNDAHFHLGRHIAAVNRAKSAPPPPKRRRPPPPRRRRPPPPRRRPPPPRRRPPPPPPTKSPEPNPTSSCDFTVDNASYEYEKCYFTSDAEEPIALYFSPTLENTIKIALRSKPGSNSRWLGFLILGPFGGMFQGDAVLNYPCGGLSDVSSACAAALNMGDSYTPPGFSTQVKNLTLVGKPKASRLPNGSNILQFEMVWIPSYGTFIDASYVTGPLTRYGTGYNALSEHELEETPIIRITKSGTMSCIKHCST